MEALEGGDVLFAAKKFNEAEILFPQGEWALKICFDGSLLLLFPRLLWRCYC